MIGKFGWRQSAWLETASNALGASGRRQAVGRTDSAPLPPTSVARMAGLPLTLADKLVDSYSCAGQGYGGTCCLKLAMRVQIMSNY